MGEKHRSKKSKRNNSRSRSRDKVDRKERERDSRKDKHKKQRRDRSDSSNDSDSRRKRREQKKSRSVEKSSEKQQDKAKKFKESDLIDSLKEQPGFLQEKYNEKVQKDKEEQEKKQIKKEALPTRAGGVYVPPHKLRQMQQEILEQQDPSTQEHQRLMWELLRKSINGIINKVNISNIQNVIIELLNENILRGKGLLARAIIKAQMASPNFTHVYAALIAVINTKLPEIINLLIRRVILQFQKAFKRNNKIVCQATLKMMAHLINQQVLSDFVALQILMLFLEDPTEDSVEMACEFMTDCGQILSELCPPGVNSIFERFRGILHEGEIDKRVQYNIENLFAVRKSKFKDHPGIIPELDLVEVEDQITHNFDVTETIDAEEMLNIFKFDPFYQKTEEEWDEIKIEILGEENLLLLKEVKRPGEDEEEEDEEEEEKVRDLTEDERMNLRRTLYLTIMSSVDFEECAHKILKMNIGQGQEEEVCFMIVDCCMNERTYLRFYGLLAQRFCELSDLFRDSFMKCFVETYTLIHRHETNKIRNSSKLFAHILYTDAIDWRILNCIELTQETTTASSRIFIKNLIQELSENLGLEDLNKRFQNEENSEYFQGLFPIDHPKNTRFAINFFTSIGVGALTENLRKVLEEQTKTYLQQAPEQLMKQLEAEDSSESSSESDSSSDSSDSDDSGSNSSSEERDNKKKKNKKK